MGVAAGHMMKMVEFGAIGLLIVAIISGAVYVGQLEGRLKALENNSVIEKAKTEAVQEISAKADQASAELAKTLHLPAGTVLPFVGNITSSIPNDWVVCEQNGTPGLSGRILMGTTDLDKIGSISKFLVDIPQNIDAIDSEQFKESLKHRPTNMTEIRTTNKIENIPFVQVLFLCKLGK